MLRNLSPQGVTGNNNKKRETVAQWIKSTFGKHTHSAYTQSRQPIRGYWGNGSVRTAKQCTMQVHAERVKVTSEKTKARGWCSRLPPLALGVPEHDAMATHLSTSRLKNSSSHRAQSSATMVRLCSTPNTVVQALPRNKFVLSTRQTRPKSCFKGSWPAP